MIDLDPTRPDRQIGAMLDIAAVERLRDAVQWVREHRGLKLKDIAASCGAAEHTVRNFAYRKSNRPDNAVLGKLSKYFLANAELLPQGYFAAANGAEAEETARPARRELVRLLKMELPIAESDLRRVFDRYCGYYLCFRNTHRPDAIAVSWLHILPLGRGHDDGGESLPLPRFTLFTNYRDRFDPLTNRSHIVVGYVFSRHGRLYFTGHYDGELKHLVLDEPETARFSYLQGLGLLTAPDDRTPFTTRIVCQYLGAEAAREQWEDRIGEIDREEFGRRFDNADIVTRALGPAVVVSA